MQNSSPAEEETAVHLQPLRFRGQFSELNKDLISASNSLNSASLRSPTDQPALSRRKERGPEQSPFAWNRGTLPSKETLNVDWLPLC